MQRLMGQTLTEMAPRMQATARPKQQDQNSKTKTARPKQQDQNKDSETSKNHVFVYIATSAGDTALFDLQTMRGLH